MFGQLREEPPGWLGVVEPWAGAERIVLVAPLVGVVEVAALAIAAPPPASAPVARSAARRGFVDIGFHLLGGRGVCRRSRREVRGV